MRFYIFYLKEKLANWISTLHLLGWVCFDRFENYMRIETEHCEMGIVLKVLSKTRNLHGY